MMDSLVEWPRCVFNKGKVHPEDAVEKSCVWIVRISILFAVLW